jgi:3'5'-cyclic nucleotide phosphodiesterase
MQPAFRKLRACLFGDQEDVKLFRSLLVKSVMATDIWDKEQAANRENRWHEISNGLAKGSEGPLSVEQLATQKAGAVVEYLIQVSDVSHATQHLSIFTKWNKLLFKETFLSYKAGRANSNPTEDWYEGELKFFDGHIVPLVKKLCECQVFRASAEICLANAINNRRKWELKGKLIVQEYLEVYETKSAVATVISQRVRRVPSMNGGSPPLFPAKRDDTTKPQKSCNTISFYT